METENVSEAKDFHHETEEYGIFVPPHERIQPEDSIMDDIFEKKLKIGYYIHPDCKFSVDQEKEIAMAIENALWTWAEQFADIDDNGKRANMGSQIGQNVFEGLVVEKVPTSNYGIIPAISEIVKDSNGKVKANTFSNDSKQAIIKKNVVSENYLLTVYFYCGFVDPELGVTGFGRGRTYRWSPLLPGEKTAIHIYLPNMLDPVSKKSKLSDSIPQLKQFDIGDTGANMFVLSHELGHAFGLRHIRSQKAIMYYDFNNFDFENVKQNRFGFPELYPIDIKWVQEMYKRVDDYEEDE